MKKTNEKVLMSVIAGMIALQGVSSTMMNIMQQQVMLRMLSKQ